MLLTVGVLAFGASLFVVVYAFGDFVLERQHMFKTLRRVRSIEAVPEGMNQELAAPFMSRVLIPMLRKTGGFTAKLTPAGVIERLRQEVIYAGSPAGWDAERILAVKALTLVGGFLVGGALTRLLQTQASMTLMLSVVFAMLGYYVPEWVVRSKSGKRQKAIQRALPDALDLLSITVEAGLGFDAAVSRVSRQSGGPLGEELHRVIQEMQIGKRRADALRDMADRSTVSELKSFVLAMIQADIFGISIAKVLHVQAAELRLKRRQRAEEAAQKIPVKIIFPLLTCIFPALFVILLGPAMISIYNNIIKGTA